MDVKEIESAIAQLPPAKVAELAEWFEEFHAQLWDNQLEEDLKSGIGFFARGSRAGSRVWSL